MELDNRVIRSVGVEKSSVSRTTKLHVIGYNESGVGPKDIKIRVNSAHVCLLFFNY